MAIVLRQCLAAFARNVSVFSSFATTTTANELIILALFMQPTDGSPPISISSVVDNVGLTWQRRGGGSWDPGFLAPLELTVEYWWAIAPAADSYHITATASEQINNSIFLPLLATGIDLAGPWDSNSSLPVMASGTFFLEAPALSGISTTASRTMLFNLDVFSGTPGASILPPLAQVGNAAQNFDMGTNNLELSIGNEFLSAPATGLSIVPTDITRGCTLIIDALVAAPAAIPSITSISPTFGPSAGGTAVLLQGTGFGDVTEVTFGIAQATSFFAFDDNFLSATSPPHSGGIVDVVATSSAGSSPITSADEFTYTVVAIVLDTDPLDIGTVGTPYMEQLGLSGGQPPYNFTPVLGLVPTNGLSLSNVGLISGIPQFPGNFTLRVSGADSTTPTPVTFTFSPVLTVAPAPMPPSVSLVFSDTKGKSWGNPILQSIGNFGAFLTNVQWRRLGMARDRVFEVSWSLDAEVALNGAFVEFEVAET